MYKFYQIYQKWLSKQNIVNAYNLPKYTYVYICNLAM